MTVKTEYKENLTKEEINSLAAVLFDEIKRFYNTDKEKQFFESYKYKTEQKSDIKER